MNYTVIDSKTDKHTYGTWPAKETVETTISLVEMDDGNFGLKYDSKFSGIKSGHVQGGPYQVDGNMEIKVNDNPKVMLIISNYNKTEEIIVMSVKITVNIPVIGTKTIFNETLSGNYTSNTGWGYIAINLTETFNTLKQLV